jgi:hypothetical protein
MYFFKVFKIYFNITIPSTAPPSGIFLSGIKLLNFWMFSTFLEQTYQNHAKPYI